MGKRKTSEEMSRAYAGRFPARYQVMVREAHEAGQRANHRANRISAAERRVVEAVMDARNRPCMATQRRMHAAIRNLEALQRAKGGANG